MSNRAHASSARGDFAFPASDQAASASQQAYGRYDGDRASNAPAQDAPPLRYQDFTVEQAQQLDGQFQGFPFNPSAPFSWDWTNSLDFAGFTNQYEPQGELAQELQNQTGTINDFNIPMPVTAANGGFQVPPQSQSAPPVTASSQPILSPPPKPPQRPAVQTGVKRKIESEPTSAVSQSANDTQSNPAKRQNKSRQSSEASLTSPGIPPTPEARTAPNLQTSQSDPMPKINTEPEKRKEPSKGTGPQGRVIDVSTPRKIVESPGSGEMLPAGKVFPIQIGSELFRLSGASLSSDEHPHTSRISSATNYTTMAVVLVT